MYLVPRLCCPRSRHPHLKLRPSAACPRYFVYPCLPSPMPLVLLGLIHSSSPAQPALSTNNRFQHTLLRTSSMACGATYSRSSGPVSLRLRLVATGVNRLDHFCLLGPLRASMCLPLPLCALKVVARAPVAGPLFQFLIPTVFRPNSAYSTSSPALWLFISRMSYTRCPQACKRAERAENRPFSDSSRSHERSSRLVLGN